MAVFKKYAQYYDALYRDKDYAGEARDIQKLLTKHGVAKGRLINFGCGTGRHDFELEKLGYECHGIDMSEDMVEEARTSAQKYGRHVVFDIADIRNYNSEEKYDAVISLFHVMSYQSTNADLISAIKSAANCLERGGIFLFDCWYGPGVLTDRPEVRTRELQIESGRVIRIARPRMYPNDNLVDVEYELLFINSDNYIESVAETHRMRYLFAPETGYLLEKAGFELLEILDTAELDAPSFDTWTAYFIAKKSADEL